MILYSNTLGSENRRGRIEVTRLVCGLILIIYFLYLHSSKICLTVSFVDTVKVSVVSCHESVSSGNSERLQINVSPFDNRLGVYPSLSFNDRKKEDSGSSIRGS